MKELSGPDWEEPLLMSGEVTAVTQVVDCPVKWSQIRLMDTAGEDKAG